MCFSYSSLLSVFLSALGLLPKRYAYNGQFGAEQVATSLELFPQQSRHFFLMAFIGVKIFGIIKNSSQFLRVERSPSGWYYISREISLVVSSPFIRQDKVMGYSFLFFQKQFQCPSDSFSFRQIVSFAVFLQFQICFFI